MSFLSGVIGAMIGAAVTSFFHIWKVRRDEWSARTDELCKSIQDASLQAIEYWSEDYSQFLKPRVVEAKLSAAQTFIDGAYGDWRLRIEVADVKRTDDAMADLLDALTGGNFSVSGRVADPTRVEQASQAAVNCMISIRAAHRNTIPLDSIFDSYISTQRILNQEHS